MSTTNIPRGVALMLVFCILAPLLDAASKLATDAIPVGQITAARFVFQGLCMLPVILLMRLSWAAEPRDLGFLALRAIFLMLSTYCFVASVQFMPIADAMAIVFVMPFILMFLGRVIFGNPIGTTRILASVVGFGGAMLVIQPSLDSYGLIALLPLGCALTFSFYELITQAMSNRVHPVTMQLHTSLAGMIITLPLLSLFDGTGVTGLDPVMPDALNWLWLFGVGFWAAISHLSMTFAMKYAPASTLAPLHYLELVMAVALGYLIWGDFPNLLTWGGIALIVGSGLFIIAYEHRTAQRHPMPPPLPSEAI